MTGLVGYHAGLAAEDVVAAAYTSQGYQEAARRWRGQAGEIDLIMRRDAMVILIEVKKSKSFARAATRLSRRQMDRLLAAGSEFVADEPRGQLTDMRFDLALVDQTGAVDVIENAFMEV